MKGHFSEQDYKGNGVWILFVFLGGVFFMAFAMHVIHQLWS